jgi:hypothetical protein
MFLHLQSESINDSVFFFKIYQKQNMATGKKMNKLEKTALTIT